MERYISSQRALALTEPWAFLEIANVLAFSIPFLQLLILSTHSNLRLPLLPFTQIDLSFNCSQNPAIASPFPMIILGQFPLLTISRSPGKVHVSGMWPCKSQDRSSGQWTHTVKFLTAWALWKHYLIILHHLHRLMKWFFTYFSLLCSLPHLVSTLKLVLLFYRLRSYLPHLVSTLKLVLLFYRLRSYLPHLVSTLKLMLLFYSLCSNLPHLVSTLKLLVFYRHLCNIEIPWFQGILWDSKWIAPSIVIYSHTCGFCYRNAFIHMKL